MPKNRLSHVEMRKLEMWLTGIKEDAQLRTDAELVVMATATFTFGVTRYNIGRARKNLEWPARWVRRQPGARAVRRVDKSVILAHWLATLYVRLGEQVPVEVAEILNEAERKTLAVKAEGQQSTKE